MTGFDSWESYFYPETIEPLTGIGTLRNLYDERDARVLARSEYVETSGRAQQLLDGSVAIAKTFDGAHVRAIHRHLFQDVYEWAGEYRTVNLLKGGGRPFGDIRTGEMQRYLADVHQLVDGTSWSKLDRRGFVEQAATVFAYLNQAHPFREGNGRTSKVFMQHVAELSSFSFDFARVTPQIWNQGSAMSRPDLEAYAPDTGSLVPVFGAITIDRGAEVRPHEEAWRAVGLARAAYPKPGTGLGLGGPAGPASGRRAPGGQAGYRDRGGAER